MSLTRLQPVPAFRQRLEDVHRLRVLRAVVLADEAGHHRSTARVLQHGKLPIKPASTFARFVSLLPSDFCSLLKSGHSQSLNLGTRLPMPGRARVPSRRLFRALGGSQVRGVRWRRGGNYGLRGRGR